MSKEMRDVCLFVGTAGIVCAWGVVLLALLSGIKLIKVVAISGALLAAALCLFYLGLAPTIKRRLSRQLRAIRI